MGRTTSSATMSDQSALSEEEQIARNYDRGRAYEEFAKAIDGGRRFIHKRFGIFPFVMFPTNSAAPYLVIETRDGIRIEVHDTTGFPTDELIAEIMLLKG
jgi:hypothetical protein